MGPARKENTPKERSGCWDGAGKRRGGIGGSQLGRAGPHGGVALCRARPGAGPAPASRGTVPSRGNGGESGVWDPMCAWRSQTSAFLSCPRFPVKSMRKGRGGRIPALSRGGSRVSSSPCSLCPLRGSGSPGPPEEEPGSAGAQMCPTRLRAGRTRSVVFPVSPLTQHPPPSTAQFTSVPRVLCALVHPLPSAKKGLKDLFGRWQLLLPEIWICDPWDLYHLQSGNTQDQDKHLSPPSLTSPVKILQRGARIGA